ncbi:hypothetical protein BLAT2472_40279 [Burkholderia latens]
MIPWWRRYDIMRRAKEKTREAVRHRGFRGFLERPWKRIWWAPRESNPAPTNYEFAALTKHELGAQMGSTACYALRRQ